MALAILGKVGAIEAQIDALLDTLSRAGMMFEQIVKHYLAHGPDADFQERCARLKEEEKAGNKMSSDSARALFTEMLIPESRGDVLSLLQSLDYLLDRYDHVTGTAQVEHPDVAVLDDAQKQRFVELTENVVKSVESVVTASRAFFKDTGAVEDHLYKVAFYEEEVDELSRGLKRDIFASDMPLAQKMHLRSFIDMLDDISDEAEDAAEDLAIFNIKRKL